MYTPGCFKNNLKRPYFNAFFCCKNTTILINDKFFEFYSANYQESNNFIDLTLANHKQAMLKTLESESLPIVRTSDYFVDNEQSIGYQLGYFFTCSILETLLLAHLGGVDPFGQDAVEKQKKYLN